MKYSWDDAMIGIRRNVWLRGRRLGMFGLQPSDRILDLGCGDGLDMQILKEKGYNNIMGVDISPTLVKLATVNNPGVRVVRASADKLPFKNGCFDVVVADSMVYHLAGNTTAIREIRRVLTPTGRFCFIDMHASWLRTVFNVLTFSPFGRLSPYLMRRRKA
jgi:ubiquinone/menaquinone biosynthesis C-methylase UbiE